MTQSETLRNEISSSWLADLGFALQQTSYISFSRWPMSMAPQSLTNVLLYVWEWLQSHICSNPRLYLLHNCKEPLPDGSCKQITSTLHYLLQLLTVATDHRRCLTNLLLVFSSFRVLALHGVSDKARLCRPCRNHTETPNMPFFNVQRTYPPELSCLTLLELPLRTLAMDFIFY